MVVFPKMATTQLIPLFAQIGILASPDDPNPDNAIPVLQVEGTQAVGTGKITATLPDKSKKEYAATDITLNSTTDTLSFIADDIRYLVRDLREDDGEWLSSIHTMLPVPALENLIREGAPMDPAVVTDEALTAYAMDDSVYVVGLVYRNAMGDWSRVDGDWSLLPADDTTFDDMIAMQIDPDRSQEYIDMFDNNYVTVTDTEDFEAPDMPDETIDNPDVPVPNTPAEAEGDPSNIDNADNVDSSDSSAGM